MNFKKLLSVLLVTSVMLLLAACGGSDDKSETKPQPEAAPQVEEGKTEKKEEEKDKEIEIIKLTTELVGTHDINVVTTASGEGIIYAHYVLKNNEFYEKLGYQKDNKFTYTITEPGNYKVRVFVKDKDGNKITKDTEIIEFPY